MSVKIRRIDFSPDEWIAGTLGMTPEEEGIYIKICALIWSTGASITTEHLKRCTACHGNKINAILRQLEVAGKITRNGREIDQKRARKELENAEKRIGKARENASKRWKHKGLRNADASQRSNANHQLSTTSKEERFSHKELNLSVLTPREATPPLPSQGDGGAASRSRTTKEPEVNSDDLITPEQRAAGLAEFHRAMDAARRKAASLNGHADAAE